MTLRSILVLAEGQLGDLLLLTPALRSLRAGHPDATITVIIYQRRLPPRPAGASVLFPSEGHGTAAVITQLPCVNRVFEVDRAMLRRLSPRQRLVEEARIAMAIRSHHYDGVLCTFPEDRFAALAFLAGARVRAGERAGGLSWMLNATPAVERKEGVLAYYCTLAAAMGGREVSRQTEFIPVPEGLRRADAWLAEYDLQGKRYVAVHPGATGEYKQWPPERFARAITALSAGGIPVALCGGKGDRDILEAIITHLAITVPVFEPADLSMLAGFLMRAGVCLTNDSGPRHLAVAVGAPSLALFRRHHGREWAIYDETERCRVLTGGEECAVCTRGICEDRLPSGSRFGSTCLRQIGEDVVVLAVKNMLAATSS